MILGAAAAGSQGGPHGMPVRAADGKQPHQAARYGAVGREQRLLTSRPIVRPAVLAERTSLKGRADGQTDPTVVDDLLGDS